MHALFFIESPGTSVSALYISAPVLNSLYPRSGFGRNAGT